MQPKIFKDKITGELDASCEYMKEAINYLKSYPKWSNTFRIMSDERYDHAEQLYKIFMELCINIKGQDAYLNSLRDAIIETFASKTRLIDGYRATFDLIDPPKKETKEEKQNERDNTN